jgi:DNA (cytosine-5)-methyltransferase 1
MLKLLSLFSGIGAFEKALDNLEVHYELVNFCEFDKYAVKSYCAIHDVDESKNLGDITKVDETKLAKDIDVLTYGFPCQDISVAGKQKGLFNEDGSQTRSGLFFEALRIIEHCHPKIAIAENVKNLVSKKFNAQFQVVLASLDSAGYNSYYAVLNSKDFGVPQNRERVFIVSIRKDIDNGIFEFPASFPLEKRLKDVLEEVVDEKYYLSDKMMDYLFTITEKNKARGNGNVYVPTDPEGVSKTITTKEGSRVKDNFIEEPQLHQVGQMYPNSGNPQAGRVYDSEGISPTMDTCSGGNRMPKVLVREATKKGYAEAYEGDSINLEQPNSTTRRGRVGKQVAQTLNTTAYLQGVVVKNKGGELVRTTEIAGTLLARDYKGLPNQHATAVLDNLRIRKLTPKECFRLMGFDDESFHKAEAVNSNTQLYKQAGNSIVVDVLEELFCMMLDEDGNIYV